MGRGDKVRHKKYAWRGMGEVGFIAEKGLVFVKWLNAEIRVQPSYFKAKSLVVVEGAET